MVASVVPGSAADKGGLVAGDVITAINGTTITSSDGVSRIVLAKKPGATLTITYLDATGTTRTTRVTLASGPPQ